MKQYVFIVKSNKSVTKSRRFKHDQNNISNIHLNKIKTS
jgi:hypothetical protein